MILSAEQETSFVCFFCWKLGGGMYSTRTMICILRLHSICMGSLGFESVGVWRWPSVGLGNDIPAWMALVGEDDRMVCWMGGKRWTVLYGYPTPLCWILLRLFYLDDRYWGGLWSFLMKRRIVQILDLFPFASRTTTNSSLRGRCVVIVAVLGLVIECPPRTKI